jgi:tRNA pseudouridine55 synthase
MQKEGSLQDILIPIDAMFTQYPKTVVKQDWERLARNGNALPIKAVTCDSDCDTIGKMDSENKESAYVRLYNEAGDFIAIYRRDGKEYQIVKMFFTS